MRTKRVAIRPRVDVPVGALPAEIPVGVMLPVMVRSVAAAIVSALL